MKSDKSEQKVQLFFIYAEKCKHCNQMLSVINLAIKKSKIPCDFKKFLYTTKAAINIALNNDIDDLPGLVVGAGVGVFCGNDYTEDRIVDAINKVAKSWKTTKNQ